LNHETREKRNENDKKFKMKVKYENVVAASTLAQDYEFYNKYDYLFVLTRCNIYITLRQ